MSPQQQRRSPDDVVYRNAKAWASDLETVVARAAEQRAPRTTTASASAQSSVLLAGRREPAEILDDVIASLGAAITEASNSPLSAIGTGMSGVGIMRRYTVWDEVRPVQQARVAALPRTERRVWTVLLMLGLAVGVLVGAAAAATSPVVPLAVALSAVVGLLGTVAAVWTWSRDVERHG